MIKQSVRRASEVDRLCGHTFLGGLLGSGSTVLDLGANKGEFAHGIISRYSCRVFAIEPVSGLRAGIALAAGLTLLPFGVGGENRNGRLRVYSTRCASLLREKEGDIVGSEEEIEILDLRTVLSKLGVGTIDLMKVDIEGAELEMFESASDADLRKCNQITIEFHDFIYPEQRSQVESIKRRLRALGFRVINFSLDNTDVLFVNGAATHIGILQYLRLKYITKYLRGISRRLRGASSTEFSGHGIDAQARNNLQHRPQGAIR